MKPQLITCPTCNKQYLSHKSHNCQEVKSGYKPMKSGRLKFMSNKNQGQYNILQRIYKQIDDEREHKCEGCGSFNHLSHAHLIPRGFNKELEVYKDNIRLYCMQRQDGSKGCHQRWEGNFQDKQTVLDFNENMEYIKNKNISYYNLILNK